MSITRDPQGVQAAPPWQVLGCHRGFGCRSSDLSPMKRVRLTLRMRWMLRRRVPPPSGFIPWPTKTA